MFFRFVSQIYILFLFFPNFSICISTLFYRIFHIHALSTAGLRLCSLLLFLPSFQLASLFVLTFVNLILTLLNTFSLTIPTALVLASIVPLSLIVPLFFSSIVFFSSLFHILPFRLLFLLLHILILCSVFCTSPLF